MIQFDSFQQAVSMHGYGGYVWSAFAAFVVAFVFHPLRLRVKAKQQRNQQ